MASPPSPFLTLTNSLTQPHFNTNAHLLHLPPSTPQKTPPPNPIIPTNKPSIKKDDKNSSRGRPGFNYPALPAEIRVLILRHLVGAGEVHPAPTRWIELYLLESDPAYERATQNVHNGGLTRYTLSDLETIQGRHKELFFATQHPFPSSQPPLPSPPPLPTPPQHHKTPSLQILATNHATHNDAAAIFYAGNSFHLPPGPLEKTLQYLDNLTPEHIFLLRSLTLTFSLADLTPASLIRVDQIVNASSSSVHRHTHHRVSVEEQAWLDAMCDYLVRIWCNKLEWILQYAHVYMVRLREIRVVGWDRAVLVRGRCVSGHREKWRPEDQMSMGDCAVLMGDTVGRIRDCVAKMARENSLALAKSWILDLALRPLGEEGIFADDGTLVCF
ncbi:hypothetical protein MMC12_003342 [Toensbergia leucococca]|nr:hypothetical protein [Toensbergia leucococca]